MDAEVMLDTTDVTPEESAQHVLLYLAKVGYIGDNGEENIR